MVIHINSQGATDEEPQYENKAYLLSFQMLREKVENSFESVADV